MSLPITTRTNRFDDDRGWFMPCFHDGHPAKNWKIQNTSFSYKNTIRGLHFQSPYTQTKLITVIDGDITDVVLDINPESETYGEWMSFQLSSTDTSLPNQIYIPDHYAHGFAVTSKSALISYLADELYHPEAERSIHPLSPSLAIPWGIEHPVLSKKDAGAEMWSLTESNSDI